MTTLLLSAMLLASVLSGAIVILIVVVVRVIVICASQSKRVFIPLAQPGHHCYHQFTIDRWQPLITS